MRHPRALLAAGVVLVALVLVVALVIVGGGDDDEDAPRRVVSAKLTLERYSPPDTGVSELLVSLADPQLNTLELTGGETSVMMRCVDRRGAVAIQRPVEWPLLEEEGFPPHIHHPAGAELLARIRACRLTGPGIDFEGSVRGPLPDAPTP